MEMDYDDLCKIAATRQGLDPIMERLRSEKVEFILMQTGGFVMVVYVELHNGLIMGLTSDAGICVCLYDSEYEWIEDAGAYVKGGLDRMMEILRASQNADKDAVIAQFMALPELWR